MIDRSRFIYPFGTDKALFTGWKAIGKKIVQSGAISNQNFKFHKKTCNNCSNVGYAPILL